MNTKPTVILSPILALLQSRKVVIAIVTAAVNILIVTVPSLEPVQTELLAVFTALALALIGGISYEDAAEKGAPTTVTTGSAENVNVNSPPADEHDTRQRPAA